MSSMSSMFSQSSADRTPAVVRRTFWCQRLQPYQAVLLTLRSLVLWENGFHVLLAAIGIHVALYLLFQFVERSTFFGLFFSVLGTFLPVFFFARKAEFLKYFKRQPRPDDTAHFDVIVNYAAECDTLVDWARAQFHQRIDTINPLLIIAGTFAFSALGALFNNIPTFYVCWFLGQALLLAPGCYVHGVFHRARVLAENGIQAAGPLFQQLSQSVSASVRAAQQQRQQQEQNQSQQQQASQQQQQQLYHHPSQQALHRVDSYIPTPAVQTDSGPQPHFEQPDFSAAGQYRTTDQYQQFPSPLPAYLQPSVIPQHPELDPEFLALLTPEERKANGLE